MKDFNELEVWRKAKDLVILIYQFARQFPKEELYGLADQLKRAGNSICANIAEGFSRYHPKDKIKFYYNARGSISECKSHVYIAAELKYISQDNVKKLIVEYDVVGKMLNSMINSLNRIHSSRSSLPNP
jgi:four helix bundle protein